MSFWADVPGKASGPGWVGENRHPDSYLSLLKAASIQNLRNSVSRELSPSYLMPSVRFIAMAPYSILHSLRGIAGRGC